MLVRRSLATVALHSVLSFAAVPVFAVCGDGMKDGVEQCDAGAANGMAGSCCEADCTNTPFATPCPDTQPNNCRVAACENGFCNQSSNTLEPNDSVCGTDANPNDCVAPQCVSGTCVTAHIFASGTPCTLTEELECRTPQCNGTDTTCGINLAFGTLCTDTQANNCKKAACENGFCNQNSITIEPNGAPCGVDPDLGDCFAPLCQAAVCGTNPLPAGAACPDSSPRDCLAAQCDGAGVCDQGGGFVPQGIYCTDTAPTDHFRSECDGAGLCDQRAEEIIATPALSPAAAALAFAGLVAVAGRRLRRRR